MIIEKDEEKKVFKCGKKQEPRKKPAKNKTEPVEAIEAETVLTEEGIQEVDNNGD